jgi:hypothetical protein
LNCAHFRTDASFLDVHKAELRGTERVIAKANTNGWSRQIEMNQQKRNNLVTSSTFWSEHMPRNTEGLDRSARLRSKRAMEQKLAALSRLKKNQQPINFRSVSTAAAVSPAWLYKKEEGLRREIERLRGSQ